MAKVLLKQVGTKPNKAYLKDIAKITRITIAEQSVNAPKMEIYSFREISDRGSMEDKQMKYKEQEDKLKLLV